MWVQIYVAYITIHHLIMAKSNKKNQKHGPLCEECEFGRKPLRGPPVPLISGKEKVPRPS